MQIVAAAAAIAVAVIAQTFPSFSLMKVNLCSYLILFLSPWPLGQVLGNLDFFQSFYSKTLKSMYVLEDDMNEVVVTFCFSFFENSIFNSSLRGSSLSPLGFNCPYFLPFNVVFRQGKFVRISSIEGDSFSISIFGFREYF